MPSTTTLSSSCNTRSTRASVGSCVLPESSPVVTSTMSPLRMCIGTSASARTNLNDLGRQVRDFHKPLLTQFASDGSENARAARVLFVVDQYQGVAIEPHVTAIGSPRRLLGANDHAFDDFTRLHLAARNCLLDTGDDNVA